VCRAGDRAGDRVAHGNSALSQNVFDGNIEDVRIYDAALSAADIALLVR
jgi:hypothetical protein